MKIFTIGFTKKSAEAFFTLLKNAGVRRLVDVRLNNVSQLTAFAKKDDLRYFAKALCNMDYTHVPDLAPTTNPRSIQEAEGRMGALRAQVSRPDAVASYREKSIAHHVGRRLFTLQRGKTRPLPPPPCRRVSEGQVGRCRD